MTRGPPLHAAHALCSVRSGPAPDSLPFCPCACECPSCVQWAMQPVALQVTPGGPFRTVDAADDGPLYMALSATPSMWA